jgi:hypothetical protein
MHLRICANLHKCSRVLWIFIEITTRQIFILLFVFLDNQLAECACSHVLIRSNPFYIVDITPTKAAMCELGLGIKSWQFFGLDLFEFAFKLQYFCCCRSEKWLAAACPLDTQNVSMPLVWTRSCVQKYLHRDHQCVSISGEVPLFPQRAIQSSEQTVCIELGCGKINALHTVGFFCNQRTAVIIPNMKWKLCFLVRYFFS